MSHGRSRRPFRCPVRSRVRKWLEAPIVEADGDGKPKVSRRRQGTPQGGVVSPLLANVYQHWFDKKFYSQKGSGAWAKARLMRYRSNKLSEYVEGKLEGRMGLKINREETRVEQLGEGEASPDFLGYSFRYYRDMYGREKRYLNMSVTKKALVRGERGERAKLRELTDYRYRS